MRDGGGRGVGDSEIAAQVEESIGEGLDGLVAMRGDGVELEFELLLVVNTLEVLSKARFDEVPRESGDDVDEVVRHPTRCVDVGDAESELLRPLNVGKVRSRAELLEAKKEVDASGVRTRPLWKIGEELSIDL